MDAENERLLRDLTGAVTLNSAAAVAAWILSSSEYDRGLLLDFLRVNKDLFDRVAAAGVPVAIRRGDPCIPGWFWSAWRLSRPAGWSVVEVAQEGRCLLTGDFSPKLAALISAVLLADAAERQGIEGT